MVAMADGMAPPSFFLSSLDPGVGKTTALINFAQHLLRSDQHKDVAVLLCFSRLEEIIRLVDEMGLNEADFAVHTSDDEVNQLSTTLPDEARVLLTTHAMVMSKCRCSNFKEAEGLRYQGEVRAVRIWDEAMLPGEVASISTDQLAALRDPLRLSYPPLAELIGRLERQLEVSGGKGTLMWPDVAEDTGISCRSARAGVGQRQATYLDNIYALSGRRVLLRKPNPAASVIAALNTRDAIPDDMAPVVILDASGRIRSTYDLWERNAGNLTRLRSGVRMCQNLKVQVMYRGSGKDAWRKNGEVLAQELASLINSKPDEEWLVVYHKGVNSGAIPDQVKGLLSSNPDRVSFLNWGKHQGTNEFRHIKNVILAGMNNHPQTDYEMKARYYGGIGDDQDVCMAHVKQMEAGEHMHHILQAICRSAVRQGIGAMCGPCNAYIIAPKRSGIRDNLPKVFPGCKVSTWHPTTKRKATGKVGAALLYVATHFTDRPEVVLMFTELQSALEISNSSNFRNSIRRNETYKAGLETLGVEEVTIGNYRHRNALAMKPKPFGPVEGASYIINV
ncbi:hypothetical protein [Pseudophaeobacter sp.]|uniref:hypothetical protein n=1 Tax=Pseudophaeobacter sp. TaxID=1971739 RepID=UPI004059FDB6